MKLRKHLRRESVEACDAWNAVARCRRFSFGQVMHGWWMRTLVIHSLITYMSRQRANRTRFGNLQTGGTEQKQVCTVLLVFTFFFEKENSSRSLAEVFISSAPCCSCFFDNSMLVNVWRIRFSKRTLFDCFAILIRVSAGRVRLES